jgi:hypothetical protein
VTLINAGHFPLRVDRAVTVGAHPSDFIITNDTCLGVTLKPDATCSVEVRFAPQDVGPRAATLRFLDSTLIAGHQDLPLTGRGGPAAGLPGPAGSPGLPGPKGPAGTVAKQARTTCTAGRRRRGRVKITCRVKLARRATARLSVRIDGNTRAVATGRLRRQRSATLKVTRRLRPGRHRVVVTVRYAHTIVRHIRMIMVR